MADGLDRLIHQRTRLRLMAALHRNRTASFTDLRDGLELTAGNLKSHAAKLVEAGYLEEHRALVDRSFEMRYRITPEGSKAFEAYLDELQGVLDGAGQAVPAAPPADAEGYPTRQEPGPRL